MRYTAIALFAAIALTSAPALARHHDRGARDHFASPDMKVAARALEMRDDTLRREGNTLRIGAVEREQIADQRREVRDLQKRIDDGRPIDRYTLYHALGPSYPNYFAS